MSLDFDDFDEAGIDEHNGPNCFSKSKRAVKSWAVAHPWLLIFKILFWVINIVAGGAHLQGTVNGLELFFPPLQNNTELLHNVALPFQFADATSHIATSVLGSNEMIDGLGRMFTRNQSFWGVDATLIQKLALCLLALFLVFTAEVSSTYRNWQNNAGDSPFMRIFWVGFYLCSHIPEVLYSTMLMVREYFSGFSLNRAQEKLLYAITVSNLYDYRHSNRSELGNELVTFVLEANQRSSADSFSDADGSQRPSKEELSRQRVDRIIRWSSRAVGLLLAVPTYMVKTLSAVNGFLVLFGTDQSAMAWVLGVSGMLAEAYLEYSFTQAIIDEICRAIVYHFRGYDRPLTGHIFYSVMPKTYWTIFVLTTINGINTIPGSYYSAYGAVKKNVSSHAWLHFICWMYAFRFILQAITGAKLLLENIITSIRSHWQPEYQEFIHNNKHQRERNLRQWQVASISDPDRRVCFVPLQLCPTSVRNLCFIVEDQPADEAYQALLSYPEIQ